MRISHIWEPYALAGLLVFAGCAYDDGPTADHPAIQWQGTITTEGNVTTVINESGSVWGGTARLAEELSIGVQEGPEELMFGTIRAVAASGNRIYVADVSVPAVRVYTADGDYLGDLGREGQGPGEYTYPNGIALSEDGRVFVRSYQRILVYGPAGEPLATYTMPARMDVPLIVTTDGTTYAPVVVDPQTTYPPLSLGLRAHGPEGPHGEVLVPPRFDVGLPYVSGPQSLRVPYSAGYVWTMDRWRNLIAGASDSYRFEVLRPDGSKLRVQRGYEPVPISDEQHAAEIQGVREFQRRTRGEQWTWSGPPVPHVKPAFVKFMPTHSGRLWVLRPGPSERVGDSRWRDTYIIDAFDREGRFLGEVETIDAAWEAMGVFATDHGGPFAFVDWDTVLMPVEDEDGTIMVKRYRLVLPDEE